jgi:putative CocE/NonD family hydrolase
LQAAIEKPEGYVGLVAMQTPADFYYDLTYVGGALALGSAQGWAALQGMLDGQHAMLAGEDAEPLLGAALPTLFDPPAARAALPLRESLGLAGAAPYWAEWLEHPTRDAYWERFAAPGDHYAEIALPAYHVAGWYDLFLTGTLQNYAGLLAQNPSQVLVIGPWTHGGLISSGAGELDFGPLAAAAMLQLEADQLAFLHGLATSGTPGGRRPPVRIFVMGENVWREENEWPPARTSYTPWYFQADGGLAPAEPSGEPWQFDSDPFNPVPTVGGSLLIAEFNAAGPHDQRALDSRTDILRFVSEPLAAELEVTGPLKVVLQAATSGPSTDWTAKLIDVHPDGRAYNLADGIVRADGSAREHEIDLSATSNLFKVGHRVRVDIAGSNFPRFDRNPGNGKLSAEAFETDLTIQHQTVFPGSHIVLPVVPR